MLWLYENSESDRKEKRKVLKLKGSKDFFFFQLKVETKFIPNIFLVRKDECEGTFLFDCIPEVTKIH